MRLEIALEHIEDIRRLDRSAGRDTSCDSGAAT